MTGVGLAYDSLLGGSVPEMAFSAFGADAFTVIRPGIGFPASGADSFRQFRPENRKVVFGADGFWSAPS